MTMQKTRSDFLTSEEGKGIKQQLRDMVRSDTYNTDPGYSANSSLYPDNLISFVDKHMVYLANHPKLECGKYLANLRLMTKVR